MRLNLPRWPQGSVAEEFGEFFLGWRLIVYDDGAEELYDHRNDADEFHNLANDPAHKAIRDQLARWLPKQAAPEFKAKSERSRGHRKR
jgi:hypothetical protein